MSVIKSVSSATVFNDAVGMRMSITYSEIDEDTGTIVKDNIRVDKVIVKSADKSKCTQVLNLAQEFIDAASEG